MFKRKILFGIILAITAALLAGCAFAPVVPPRGIMYNDQKSPLFPGGAPGSKVGKASSHNFLFLFGWGDCGLKQAMDNGNISEVRHTDYRIENYMLVYQRFTILVYGE